MEHVFKIGRSRGSRPSPQPVPGPAPGQRGELGPCARIAVDRAWLLGSEADYASGAGGLLTTTALLLALADLARADACPASRSLELLREHFFGRWDHIATARARFLHGSVFQEPPLSETSSLSEAALRTLRLARLLAEEADDGVLHLRHLLGALLMPPALPEPNGAQRLLASLGFQIDLLRARCPV